MKSYTTPQARSTLEAFALLPQVEQQPGRDLAELGVWDAAQRLKPERVLWHAFSLQTSADFCAGLVAHDVSLHVGQLERWKIGTRNQREDDMEDDDDWPPSVPLGEEPISLLQYSSVQLASIQLIH